MGRSVLLRARGLDSPVPCSSCGRPSWVARTGGLVMLEETQDREEIIERVAALDIAKAELVACVRVPSPQTPGRRAQEITTYSTMTHSLLRLAVRLRELGGTRGGMGAPSGHWKPGFYL